jgi:cytochrome c-type biogenesis protein CcmE
MNGNRRRRYALYLAIALAAALVSWLVLRSLNASEQHGGHEVTGTERGED